jgi:hypothetical protein
MQVLFTHSTALAICTDYQHYPDAEIEKYVSILEDPAQPEIRRTIAYDKIACSDDPIYRQHALKIGLKDTSASILRSKILMDAMMRKDIFVIDLIESQNLTKESKTYIKENNGQLRFQAYNRDPVQGCITIYIHSKCGGNRQVKITGKFVEVTFIKFYGKFELTSNNDLEGYVISSRRSKTDKIPAKMSVF